MQYICEYSVDPSGIVSIPKGAELLSVAFNSLTVEIIVYALIDPREPRAERKIIAYETGRPVPDNKKTFIGTVKTNRDLLSHVFDLGEIDDRL